jgi:hypothetical protein
LFKVRSKVIDAHQNLHQAQTDIGLREMSFGPSQPLLTASEDLPQKSNVIAIAG